MANSTARIFGLFELDAAGTVMYSRVDPHTSGVGSASLVGRNFFDEFTETTEIQSRFRFFAKGLTAAEKFTYTYLNGQQPVGVKVMLTHISQRDYDAQEKLIIVDIRKI